MTVPPEIDRFHGTNLFAEQLHKKAFPWYSITLNFSGRYLKLINPMNETISQRGRARRACDLCRHRRIRCDGEKPACENCRLAGVSCIITPRAGLSQARSDVRRELAENRATVQQLQEALRAERARRQAPSPVFPAAPTHILDSYGFEVAEDAFRRSLSYCEPSFTSIVYRTGHIFDIEEFLDQVGYSFRARYPEHQARIIVPKWPPQGLVQCTIEYFSRAGLYSVFPVVKPEILCSNIDPNITLQPGNTIKATDLVCPVALTALLGRIHRHEPEFADAEPDAYIQAALGLLPQLMMDGDNLRTLESLVLLTLYIFPTGQLQLGELLLAMAVRILYNLGGHHQSSNQHIRALFWLCYSIDKELSLRKSQPPLINDEHCDLDLPKTYIPDSSTHRIYPPSQPLSSTELLFPSDLRLSLIKSKIYTLLYSAPAQSTSQARKLQHIRELDQELNDFKAGFPVSLPLDNFLSGMGRDVPDLLLHDMSLRGVNIHLEYWFCLGRIHASTAATSGSVAGAAGVSSPLLSSSMNLCHQTARSMLLFLARTGHFMMPGNFWIHAQNLLNSVITLFQYIVTVPSAVTVEEDLSILEGIADTFAEILKTGRCGDGGDGRFPPFCITEAFVRKLVVIVRESQQHTGAMDNYSRGVS